MSGYSCIACLALDMIVVLELEFLKSLISFGFDCFEFCLQLLGSLRLIFNISVTIAFPQQVSASYVELLSLINFLLEKGIIK